MLNFVEGGKPENPEKNPQSKDENQQQTQPTYGIGSRIWTRATLVGGERNHHCAIPAPQSAKNKRTSVLMIDQQLFFDCYRSSLSTNPKANDLAESFISRAARVSWKIKTGLGERMTLVAN